MAAEQPRAESAVRVACIQMEPVFGAKEANVETQPRPDRPRPAETAHDSSCCRSCATPAMSSSPARRPSRFPSRCRRDRRTRAWVEAARQHDAIIVAGHRERAGDTLLQQRRRGRTGRSHRHLSQEPPVGRGEPVLRAGRSRRAGLEARFGRLSVAICYDIWFPETFRLAALQGADVLCVPTNWVPMPEQPGDLSGDGQHSRHGRRPLQLACSSQPPIASASSADSRSSAAASSSTTRASRWPGQRVSIARRLSSPT